MLYSAWTLKRHILQRNVQENMERKATPQAILVLVNPLVEEVTNPKFMVTFQVTNKL